MPLFLDTEFNQVAGFQQYYRLADALIANASKEQLAECARLLALNLAHFNVGGAWEVLSGKH